jgi:GNAT superfamily N-acetyltransferase
VILRTGTAADGEALGRLVEDAFLDYARGLGRDRPGPHDWLPERLARGEIEVAEANGALLGMTALSQDADAKGVTVDLLAVAPPAQGRGVGRLLLGHAERIARDAGAKALHLHTVAKYDRLVKFYESAGFEVTHRGPRPKGDDGHPRAFMCKRLDRETA